MATHEQSDALESLLTHPGWQIWVAHVAEEWGPQGKAYNVALDQALNLLDDSAAASQARQVRAGRRVIETLLAWPTEEIARLKRQQPQGNTATVSRRGPLVPT